MTGSFFVASVPYAAHAEQLNPAKAMTFGYVVNADDNTVSVIDITGGTHGIGAATARRVAELGAQRNGSK
jgi:hypothetical protein